MVENCWSGGEDHAGEEGGTQLRECGQVTTEAVTDGGGLRIHHQSVQEHNKVRELGGRACSVPGFAACAAAT